MLSQVSPTCMLLGGGGRSGPMLLWGRWEEWSNVAMGKVWEEWSNVAVGEVWEEWSNVAMGEGGGVVQCCYGGGGRSGPMLLWGKGEEWSNGARGEGGEVSKVGEGSGTFCVAMGIETKGDDLMML